MTEIGLRSPNPKFSNLNPLPTPLHPFTNLLLLVFKRQSQEEDLEGIGIGKVRVCVEHNPFLTSLKEKAHIQQENRSFATNLMIGLKYLVVNT